MVDQSLAPPVLPHAGAWAWAVLAAWLSGVTVLAGQGTFLQPDAAVPLRIVPFAAVPPLLFMLAHRLSPALRAFVASLDLGVVVALQAWRVIGIAFVAFWAIGELPAVFALPAGIGDVAVGALAIGATLAVARRAPDAERRVRALVAWSLLDFVMAFSLAILATPGLPLRFAGAPTLVLELPLALIPAFAVPVFAILHVIAWIKVARPGRPERGPGVAATRPGG